MHRSVISPRRRIFWWNCCASVSEPNQGLAAKFCVKQKRLPISSRRNRYHFAFHGHGLIFGVARGCANMKINIFERNKPWAILQPTAKFKAVFSQRWKIKFHEIFEQSFCVQIGNRGCANFCGKNNVCLRGIYDTRILTRREEKIM